MQGFEQRLTGFLSSSGALLYRLPLRCGLNGIQLADAAQGLGRDGAPIRLMEVEELPPGVGHTGEFDHLAPKQHLIAGIMFCTT